MADNKVMVEEANEAIMELTKEEKKALTRQYEQDILGGLLAASKFKNTDDDAVKIEIVRKGVTLLTFRIRPLSEEEYQDCKNRNTIYKKNKSLGTRIAERVKAARYRSDLIYTATIDEDRTKLWDNKQAWQQLNVLNGIDLIEEVLMAGEKDMVLSKLDEISGYELTEEETAKN